MVWRVQLSLARGMIYVSLFGFPAVEAMAHVELPIHQGSCDQGLALRNLN